MEFKRASVSVTRDFLRTFPQICLCNGNQFFRLVGNEFPPVEVSQEKAPCADSACAASGCVPGLAFASWHLPAKFSDLLPQLRSEPWKNGTLSTSFCNTRGARALRGPATILLISRDACSDSIAKLFRACFYGVSHNYRKMG